jgi:valyl-tRNA synthetase
MTQELPSRYQPADIERDLYQWWTDRGDFGARADGEHRPYVIMMPPPNVTDRLHMGHGLNNTIQDVLIRFERMRGREVLWLPGTDHAGIATQNVVERLLAKEGRTRFDLGRDAFVERVWQHVDDTGATILEQLKALGASCDWSRTYFTLDEGLSLAVRETFVRLYEKGLIYRGNYIINWCPRCLTALSNEEAEKRDVAGKIWYLQYPLANGSGHVTVATTRPETMLGDTSVAVHPDDERFGALVGQLIDLPLTGRQIPIVADEGVDPDFGTGAVKVTPAHDPLDFEIGQRHGLDPIVVLDAHGCISEVAPEEFRGLDRYDARERVVAHFGELGLLEKIEPHDHAVGHCYRCGTIVEPRLSDQWFVKMAPLATPALEAYRDGRLTFLPTRRGEDYTQWLEGIRDWCISRQLWWGHRSAKTTTSSIPGSRRGWYRSAASGGPTQLPTSQSSIPVMCWRRPRRSCSSGWRA